VGTFLEHDCPAVGCPGQHSQKPRPSSCRVSISERRNWLLPLVRTAAKASAIIINKASILTTEILQKSMIKQQFFIQGGWLARIGKVGVS